MENITSFFIEHKWFILILSVVSFAVFLICHRLSRQVKQVRILQETYNKPVTLRFFSNTKYLVIHKIDGRKLLVQKAYDGFGVVIYDKKLKRYIDSRGNPFFWVAPLQEYQGYVDKVFGTGYKYWMDASNSIQGNVKTGSVIKIENTSFAVCDPTVECVWPKSALQ